MRHQVALDSTFDGTLFDDMSFEIVLPEDFAVARLTATSADKPTFFDLRESVPFSVRRSISPKQVGGTSY